MKRCNKCGETKPLEAFGKSRKEKDGLQYKCKACTNAISSAWNKAHPERLRQNAAKRFANNPEKVREKWRNDRATNPDAARKRHKKWRDAHLEQERQRLRDQARLNPEIFFAAKQKRRARMLGCEGDVTRQQLRKLKESYIGLCAYCASPAKCFDHVVPLARGGRHEIGNLVPACNACNQSKGARSLLAFMFRRTA